LSAQDSIQLPRHIAVIMDGNGRWAKKRHLPRTAGHKAGAKSVRQLVENCARNQVEVLTLFAFSSENWERPIEEVETLMDLFLTHLDKEKELFIHNQIQVRIIGEKTRFSSELQAKIQQVEELTATHTGLKLVIAASYGGQWDITQATRQIAEQVANGQLAVADITAAMVGQYICLSDLPAPDLLIRTSGESRISNFMLWQLAYTELYFTDILWPDFSSDDFQAALAFYQQRQRRFGK
jgi:undecaprenyl diphosphate synthase